MSDDIDDFLDQMKKMFNFNRELFDMDFYFLPESSKGIGFQENEKLKPFKISYHFDSSMDKPEIKIDSNLDENKIKEHLRNLKGGALPIVNNKPAPMLLEPIDATELTMDTRYSRNDATVIEPLVETSDFTDFTEIVLEVPGIQKDDIIISYGNDGRVLNFSAEKKNRKYFKQVHLPFKSSLKDYELDINNGIVSIKTKKVQT